MATSVMQVRVDEDLRAKAAAVYDESRHRPSYLLSECF